MWWEILPSFTIMMTCAAMPSVVVYITNRLFLGNPYKRHLDRGLDAHLFLRDMRISERDNPYLQKGLENLSLGDENKS